MAQSAPLDTLRELTRETRDQATQELGHLRRAHQDAQTRLEQLQHYRHEYRQRLQQSMQGGIDPASWHNYQQFLVSLDQAIDRQRQQLTEQARRVDQGLIRWQGQQRKLNAYDILAERREQDARRHATRLEQHQFDEIAARSVRRRNETNNESLS
ncbi:flagellar export protein FliJ [Halomonas shantousis]